MSNLKIELFNPDFETLKYYDDEIINLGGLAARSLYHGQRKVRGTYTVSYKYLYPVFIIAPNEMDLISALGFDIINSDCNENDLKKVIFNSFS